MDTASEPDSVSTRLGAVIRAAVAGAGGWLPFDRFMSMALYEPGLGYYAHEAPKFGLMPASGSDFVTAPEMSPFFGRALAAQLRQALDASASDRVVEFGAGSGALAGQLLDTMGDRVGVYEIVELSAALRARQQAKLSRFGDRVRWLDRLPEAIHGAVIGNEVLDAMPVQLLAWDGTSWLERGVIVDGDAFAWQDRPTALRPPLDPGFAPGAVTEIHPQARAFMRSLGERLQRGAAFFFDYGFPEAEYYHPQRAGGTLMCHRGHQADTDPLADVGLKDITAHVDFTGIALAGQDAGLSVTGYTTQAHFLINCGLLDLLEAADAAQRGMAQKLIAEHEMGELFKVIGFASGIDLDPLGFARGDRTHRL